MWFTWSMGPPWDQCPFHVRRSQKKSSKRHHLDGPWTSRQQMECLQESLIFCDQVNLKRSFLFSTWIKEIATLHIFSIVSIPVIKTDKKLPIGWIKLLMAAVKLKKEINFEKLRKKSHLSISEWKKMIFHSPNQVACSGVIERYSLRLCSFEMPDMAAIKMVGAA